MSDDSSFLYRDHREFLEDSVETVREIKTRGALVSELKESLDQYGVGKYDCSKLTIKPYGFDERINWDCYVVHLEGYGVFGFTNGIVK